MKECQVMECSDGLLIVSMVEVEGRVDNDTSIPMKDKGTRREGGTETTILYFDGPTSELLKEWYRA